MPLLFSKVAKYGLAFGAGFTMNKGYQTVRDNSLILDCLAFKSPTMAMLYVMDRASTSNESGNLNSKPRQS